MYLPPLSLIGAKVLRPEGFSEAPVGVAEGLISDAQGHRVDLSGCLILPGIVDPHGDGFERHLAPRRGAASDLGQGLRAVEAELAANGITTAILAQFWSWEGGMRSPDFAAAFCTALADHDARANLRLQLRLELGCYEAFDAALALIEQHEIGYVVFNDHLPHRQLAAGKRVPRLEGQALKSGRSPADHLALLTRLHDQIENARARLPALCAALARRGVLLGSHDDDTGPGRAFWRGLGASIAEFPVTADAALAAREGGDPIILGAPNVMRGGSHSKGINARDFLVPGAAVALASDYHYPAPLGAMSRLVADGWDLAEAWPLVSSGPACILGLQDRGEVALGKRADLAIVDPGLSQVQATIAGGQLTYLAGPIAARFMV
jgi:alpha-D-ribose 1-methylphosphonate 5-triphosphate diphosphatase